MKGKRFLVKKVIRFNLIFGYKLYDTQTCKYLPYHFEENEEYLAKSKCELKNAFLEKN